MDLRITVAASMLPASRTRAASAFKSICQQSRAEPLIELLEACGLPAPTHRALLREALDRADDALESAERLGMAPVVLTDGRYPTLLACIPDPPPVLWVRGDPAVISRPTVAIVGSRAATGYAQEVAGRLAGELAERGLVVSSGLARGVDSAAHRGCLEGGGLSVAVLGSGLDRIYPPEHGGLAVSISRQGALVSELGPGAAPLPEHFPLRNRIISGISLAVVVVEASEKSGSLITARCALEQGRDVMAVPGNVLSGRNRGSHGLLKDGAKVVETADDILEELGWPARKSDPVQASSRSLETDPLLTRMDEGEVYRLEELVERTGWAAHKLLPRLMDLELRGSVSSLGAGRFSRTAK
ncbi:MAG TPA: DNA-processing protein DprA [Vicinamibacterales bacterium]|nr:DNA-processing protein DprA [Vicinamibacterales bacterium]